MPGCMQCGGWTEDNAEFCNKCFNELVGDELHEWRIVVDGQAVEQARPRFARTPMGMKVYDTENVKEYKTYFKTMVATQKPRELFDCPLCVDITITKLKPKSWSKKRVHADTKPDVDNFAKLICDCLEGLVYKNDSRIVDLRVRKVLGASPRVTVTVKEAER